MVMRGLEQMPSMAKEGPWPGTQFGDQALPSLLQDMEGLAGCALPAPGWNRACCSHSIKRSTWFIYNP